ncbi:hypothetical protein Tb927.8.3670 [Trypanosoma brucei brucei TREU927]|uniref:T. brucei spp.-specific protein n=1 Tax=Trypanosoma brucei brucei (strain 927/4 GUTat10.1) TaxID=185431 RepID=Q580Y7_TRYB2|nr:hypothetical protein Tb927.8.3670 [Trypanosoma brucei brucei TREU927]AAX78966.1 hypothetical protein Tb927.8.3670 [Trypanosoma brucei]AAZ13132.1 hypothetical protein Tb927.8.3670 [Trypanosoma brucei brucei TREU927]
MLVLFPVFLLLFRTFSCVSYLPSIFSCFQFPLALRRAPSSSPLSFSPFPPSLTLCPCSHFRQKMHLFVHVCVLKTLCTGPMFLFFFPPPFCLLYFALLSLVREGRCRYHFHTQRQDGEGKGKRNKIASAGNERSRCSCRWCLMLLYYFSAPPSCAVPLAHEN